MADVEKKGVSYSTKDVLLGIFAFNSDMGEVIYRGITRQELTERMLRQKSHPLLIALQEDSSGHPLLEGKIREGLDCLMMGEILGNVPTKGSYFWKMDSKPNDYFEKYFKDRFNEEEVESLKELAQIV